MKVVGVTGTSGSGKTTLSKILNENENVKVIDADKVVREMSVPGTKYLEAIKKEFGQEIFLEDGNLNRKLLGNKIYNDNNSREKLNKLTFKYVVTEILNRIENITDRNIVIIDAPLLFEAELDKCCNYVIVLVADKELKIERICKRDNIDRKTAESRLKIQHEDSYYTEKADFIIENNRNCDLKSEVENILKQIKN